MTYQSVPAETFSGLNLVDDPGTVGWGGAIDLLNVEFDRRGRVRSRDGFTHFTSVAAAARYDSVWPSVTGGVVAARGVNIDGINSSGAVVATQNMTTAGACAVRFGSPTATLVYVANTTSALKWDGAAWTALGTLPKAGVVAIQPIDNRLAFANTGSLGGPGGVASSAHHVWFSDAGAPETYGANNFVQLTPGDGGVISSLVAWRDLLFAFKDRRFFVFYGNSTDSSGNPIFNYRTVDTGIGTPFTGNASGQSAVAGTDAVYFVNRRGVYRTTGGPPELISRPIDPFFVDGTSSFWQGSTFGAVGTQQPVLTWHEERLYLAIQGSQAYNNLMFVYDPTLNSWTAWDIPASSLCSKAPSGSALRFSLVFSYATGSNHLGVWGSSSTTDDGTAITSRYRSGFSDLGNSNMKTVREWILDGIGSPTFQTSHDFGSLETGAAVTLGTSPATSEGRRRSAVRGRQVSWQIGGTTAWTLNNLTANVREQRLPGVHSAA